MIRIFPDSPLLPIPLPENNKTYWLEAAIFDHFNRFLVIPSARFEYPFHFTLKAHPLETIAACSNYEVLTLHGSSATEVNGLRRNGLSLVGLNYS